jgi:hypothetical protein
MRSAFFIAAGVAIAISGPALAASQTPAGTSNMPATDAPMQSSGSQATAPPDTSSTPSTSGSAADTSATAGGSAAAASLSVGEPVKDNTGATIGAISSINTNANGQQMAVIKMGNDTFQVPGDRLGVTDGSATINLSQAQITGMIHPAAGGR